MFEFSVRRRITELAENIHEWENSSHLAKEELKIYQDILHKLIYMDRPIKKIKQ